MSLHRHQHHLHRQGMVLHLSILLLLLPVLVVQGFFLSSPFLEKLPHHHTQRHHDHHRPHVTHSYTTATRQGPTNRIWTRLSMVFPFRDEPWFHDTMHVNDEDQVILETNTETDREEQHAHPHPHDGMEDDHMHTHTTPMAAARRKPGTPVPPEEYKVGIIVVDHGSRRKDANIALEGVVADFQALSGYELVEAAHMELAEPSIATAFGRCVERGATFIICHPFFLSKGRHVVEDIPTLMEEAASIFPGVEWALSQPLGLQAEIPRLMQKAVSDCMAENNIQSEDHAGPILVQDFHI